MADILSGIGATLRPLAKELIKGGIYLFDTVSEVALEAGEKFKDIVAEARADLAQQSSQPPAEEASAKAEASPAEEANGEVEKNGDQSRRRRKTRVPIRGSR